MRASLLYKPTGGVRFIRVAHQGFGPPLLLINGLSRPLESWEPLADVLKDRHIIAFDAPGIGLSPRPSFPLTINMLAELALRVLDEFKVTQADVLGYSHGGAVAQQLALDTPERVRHLVLAATTPGLGAPVGDLSALAATTSDHSWPTSDPLGVTWRLAAITSWSSLPLLSRIAQPTLVVSAQRDRIIPALTTDLLATAIPGATSAVLDADHDLQAPAVAPQLAVVVENFLAS